MTFFKISIKKSNTKNYNGKVVLLLSKEKEKITKDDSSCIFFSKDVYLEDYQTILDTIEKYKNYMKKNYKNYMKII